MISRRRVLVMCALTLMLAACSKSDSTYQGWIEANLIFVAPDEVGRVQTLGVKEGDVVKVAQPLFTVDDDLQQADLAQVKASLTNAQQTYDSRAAAGQIGFGDPKRPRCGDDAVAGRTSTPQFRSNKVGAPLGL